MLLIKVIIFYVKLIIIYTRKFSLKKNLYIFFITKMGLKLIFLRLLFQYIIEIFLYLIIKDLKKIFKLVKLLKI